MEDIKTIPEYIEQYKSDAAVFERLNLFYNTIKAVIPEASEKISWRMPTFYKKGNIIHFACHKSHVGLYPGVEAIVSFEKELCDYKHSKGAIQMPFSKEFPKDLVERIAVFCYNEDQKI